MHNESDACVVQVEPFHFETDSRSHQSKQSLQQRVDMEQQVAADAAEFKAMPMPNMAKKFTVAPSEKELTTVPPDLPRLCPPIVAFFPLFARVA